MRLIYNFDRTTGNVLVDDGGKLWMIDHTRTFKGLPKLPDAHGVALCDRDLWQRLKGLDEDRLRAAVSPYLDAIQVAALVKRHRLLVDHIEQKISETGEEFVLFDRI